MTKIFAYLVTTFIYLMMMVPATAFTQTGEVIDKSTAYPDTFPWWQAMTAERGDHIFGGCQAFQEASWPKCLLAVVTENRDKFPARFTRESDFYLRVGETYLFPVVPGVVDQGQTVIPANLEAEQKAFFTETIKVLNDFDTQLSELKNVTLTESQVQAMIDEALRAVVISPADVGLADLQSTLADQIDRLTKLESRAESQAQAIDDLDSRVKTAEDQGLQLTSELAKKASQTDVDTLVKRVSELETRPVLTDDGIGKIVDTKVDSALTSGVGNQEWLSALAGALAGLVILLLAWWLHWYRPDTKAIKKTLAEQQVQMTSLHKQTADLADRVQGFDETLGILLERDAESRYKAPKGLEQMINDLEPSKSLRLTITRVKSRSEHPNVYVFKDVDKNGDQILRFLGVQEGSNVLHAQQKNGEPFFAISQLFRLLDKAEKSGHIDGFTPPRMNVA